MSRIPFIITIDTEGDNLWSKPGKITTKNSKYLPRFQELCEKYDLKPVYLTNWEMANCKVFKEFGRDIISRNTGEIGMHLHAWNSPPTYDLTKNDYKYHPFLLEYPREIMQNKIDTLTKKLEDVFQVPIKSHRAGRWALNNTYFQILREAGYNVDCSVTPYVDWTLMDHQYKMNNINYSYAPVSAYFIDEDILREGNSNFLQVPVTIVQNPRFKMIRSYLRNIKLTRIAINRFHPELLWLRPNGRNLNYLLYIINSLLNDNAEYAELMLHSSEFMPGGSPTFKNVREIENLYSHLNVLFENIKNMFVGTTISEFRNYYINKKFLSKQYHKVHSEKMLNDIRKEF